AIEKAIAYSKSVYEVSTQTGTELTKAAERRVAEWNENFVSLLDKAAKQAAEIAEANVAAASETVKGMAKTKKAA
ncbi:MAG TPA: phasin family protein, partial [Burkholderiales bacterium]|nr:phasin family protein [Burkholderiales bacterium]